jgi:hypothetical protein
VKTGRIPAGALNFILSVLRKKAEKGILRTVRRSGVSTGGSAFAQKMAKNEPAAAGVKGI